MLLANAETILMDYPGLFSPSNFLIDFIRDIGWIIVTLLRYLCNGVETLLDSVYDFLTITNSSIFLDFYNQFRPLIIVSLTISLIVLGSVYMMTEKRPEILKNFIIGLMVIFAAPTFIQYLNDAIFTSKEYFTSDLSLTDSIIQANIVDLLYMDEIGWDMNSSETNSLVGNALEYLDSAEHVNRKNNVSSLGQELFDKRVVIDDDGSVVVKEMGAKGWFDIFDPPYYYRYDIHFFQIYILLIVNIFVIVFASYKAFMLINEILISQILGALFAMELTSGQKTKKIIEGFFSAYISLFFILVSLKLYSVIQAYINTQSYNAIVRVFMLIFAAFLVMDGPNLVEKVFGYDVGFGSGAQKFMSLIRLGMEGMQLKYYAGMNNLGKDGIGNAFSNFASNLDNKTAAFGNHFRGNSTEPPASDKQGPDMYNVSEPNTASDQASNNASTQASDEQMQAQTAYNQPSQNSNEQNSGFSYEASEPSLNENISDTDGIQEPDGSIANSDSMNTESGNDAKAGDTLPENNGDSESLQSGIGNSDSLNASEGIITEPAENTDYSLENQSNDNTAANSENNENMDSSNMNALHSGANNQEDHSYSGNEDTGINNDTQENTDLNSGANAGINPEQNNNSQFNTANAADGQNSSTPNKEQNIVSGNDSNTFANASATQNTAASSAQIEKNAESATNSTHNNNQQENYAASSEKEQILDKKFDANSTSPHVIEQPNNAGVISPNESEQAVINGDALSKSPSPGNESAIKANAAGSISEQPGHPNAAAPNSISGSSQAAIKDSTPELVSGSPQAAMNVPTPDLASGPSQAAMNDSAPELVSGSPQAAMNAPTPDLASGPSQAAMNDSAPELVSGSLQATMNAPTPDLASGPSQTDMSASAPELVSGSSQPAINIPTPDLASGPSQTATNTNAADSKTEASKPKTSRRRSSTAKKSTKKE